MAARILSSSEVLTAAPMRWTTVRDGTAARKAIEPPQDDDETQSETAALQARVTELEREMQTRVRQAYSDGESAGVKQAEERLQPVAGKLVHLIEEIDRYKPRLRREAERDLVALALEIARRVLRRELTVDPSAILGVVKAALEKIDAREVIRIRVHPADQPVIAQWAENDRLPPSIEIEADPGLECGAVLLDSTRGQFDASIETQLREIERGFADVEGAR